MALSENLQTASDKLDEVENEEFPTTYGRDDLQKLVDVQRLLITEIDALQNP